MCCKVGFAISIATKVVTIQSLCHGLDRGILVVGNRSYNGDTPSCLIADGCHCLTPICFPLILFITLLIGLHDCRYAVIVLILYILLLSPAGNVFAFCLIFVVFFLAVMLLRLI